MRKISRKEAKLRRDAALEQKRRESSDTYVLSQSKLKMVTLLQKKIVNNRPRSVNFRVSFSYIFAFCGTLFALYR